MHWFCGQKTYFHILVQCLSAIKHGVGYSGSLKLHLLLITTGRPGFVQVHEISVNGIIIVLNVFMRSKCLEWCGIHD